MVTRQFYEKLKLPFKKVKSIVVQNKDKLVYFKDLVILVVVYGIMLNLSLNLLLNIKFSLLNIISSGLLFYLIKTELPIIIKECKQ